MSEERAAIVRFHGDASEVYRHTRKHQRSLSCPLCKFCVVAEWTPMQWPGAGATREQVESYQRRARDAEANVNSAEAAYIAHSCEEQR